MAKMRKLRPAASYAPDASISVSVHMSRDLLERVERSMEASGLSRSGEICRLVIKALGEPEPAAAKPEPESREIRGHIL